MVLSGSMSLRRVLTWIHTPQAIFGLFLSLFLLGSSSWAGAQNFWTNGGVGNDWDTAGNWSAGVPSASDEIRLGNDPPDEEQVLNITGTVTLSNGLQIESGGDRDYVINGGTIDWLRDPSNHHITLGGTGTASLTINSNITISDNESVTGNTIMRVTGAGERVVNLNGNVTTGTGTTGKRIQMDASNAELHMRGTNDLNVFLAAGGETVVYNASALGVSQLQMNNSAIISLASDLDLGANNTFILGEGRLRIRETTMSSEDRIINFNSSRALSSNTDGQLRIVENINSTGRVILNFQTSNANLNNLSVDLGETGLYRFSQTGVIQYGPNANGDGIISGDGDLEVINGGGLRLQAANTYTGTTTLTNESRLLLEGAGTIQGTSNLILGTGTEFDISGIDAATYTFGPGQTISGTGSILGDGKNLTVEGAISPGNSPGILTIDLNGGTLGFGETVDLRFDLGTSSDSVLMSGTVLDLGAGSLEFDNFTFTAGSGFGIGTYTLFADADEILGFFGSNLSGSINGFQGILGLDGDNVILNVIPEPGSALLALLAGCMVMILSARRRRS